MECPDCGGPCYDNRLNKRNPNSPDFRCKDRDCGWAKWLTKKGDPSRKRTFKKEQGGIAAPETNVLRRQSAQAKALAYLDTKVQAHVAGLIVMKSFPDNVRIKLLINWFENDAVNGSIALRKPIPKPEPAPEPEPEPEDDPDDLEATEPPDDGEKDEGLDL